MHSILFRLKTLLFSFSLICGCYLAQGQTQQNPVLVISPHVGEVIDLEEKVRFNLFPYVPDSAYMIGRFFQLPDKQIVLEVVKRDGKTVTRNFTQSEFDLTGQLIDSKAGNSQKAQLNQDAKPQPISSDNSTAQKKRNTLTGRVFYVMLRDDTHFFANITEKRENEYVFTTQHYGTITASFSDIRYLKEVENKLTRDTYWIPNPHDSRLFFGPTGRGIPKGEGYFQTIYGYLNAVNYGITDNFSIGTTFVLVPGLPLEYSIYSLTPKVSLPVAKNTNLAAGVLYATFYGEDFGIVYGAGTYGNKNDHFTAGIGYTFLNSDVSKKPVFMFGGVKRLANRISLMTENYALYYSEKDNSFEEKNSVVAGLYGLRIIWPRTNLDLAGLYVYNSYHSSSTYSTSQSSNFFTSYMIPMYASFTFKFGNRKQIGKVY